MENCEDDDDLINRSINSNIFKKYCLNEDNLVKNVLNEDFSSNY